MLDVAQGLSSFMGHEVDLETLHDGQPKTERVYVGSSGLRLLHANNRQYTIEEIISIHHIGRHEDFEIAAFQQAGREVFITTMTGHQYVKAKVTGGDADGIQIEGIYVPAETIHSIRFVR